MLSKLPVILAVTALTLAGDVIIGPTVAPVQAPPEVAATLETATLSGAVLSWEGLGSADPMLGPAILARVSLVLEGPSGIRSAAIDGRGHFDVPGLQPGRYCVKILWDGRLVHEHGLSLSALDGAAVAVHVDERPNGARVAIRAIGCTADVPGDLWSDSADGGFGDVVDGCAELDLGPAVELEPTLPEPPAAMGIRPPAQTSMHDLDEGDWADTAQPATLPDMLDAGMMIDPDVCVSKLHESDPLGFGGAEVQAI